MPSLDTTIARGADIAVLDTALLPGRELAVLQRPRPAALAAWLDALPAPALPESLLKLHHLELPLALLAACEASGTPAGPERDALIADIARLGRTFARLSGSPQLRLRLAVIDNDACRRWHRDCVDLRLLCTYRGPGTEWLPQPLAEAALARPDDDAADQCRAATHDVLVYRGCRGGEGGSHDHGLLHRSPRIAGTGLARLLLCLEAA